MRRKGNLRQKIVVGFLSVMLVIGMAVGAVPTEVFAAEENTETVESVSESTTESVAEEPVVENETEPETVKENEVEPETITGEAQRQADPAVNGDIVTGNKWKLDTTTGVLTIDSGGDLDWGRNRTAYASQVKSVEIRGNVSGIGMKLFLDCINLRSITMSSNIQIIGNSAFEGCSSLETIKIPDGVWP